MGKFFRYVLNINTIWGWMILVSFVVCAVRNYLPTKTTIPGAALSTGDNDLTLQIADAAGKSFDYQCRASLGPSGLVLQPLTALRLDGPPPPQVASVEQSGDTWIVKWNMPTHGEYRLLVNGKIAAGGSIIKLAGFTDAAFEYAKKGFDIALGLVSSMVLCLGLMKVGEDAGIVQLVARLFHPIIRFLFPEVPKDHPANGAILMNITTSVLGLGNASTPFGLKAMQELESINPHKGIASNSQVMLLAYNTTGIALLPTTIIATRKAAGCSDPFEIIGTSLLAGSIATIVAIVMAKLLGRLPFFSVQSALAEQTQEAASAKASEVQA